MNNNNNYWLVCLFFLGFLIQAFGQNTNAEPIDSNFLKNYVPPNFKFQTLQLNPSFRESITRSNNLDRNRLEGLLYGYYSLLTQKDNSDTNISVNVRSNVVSDERNDNKEEADNYFSFILNSQADKYFYFSGEAFVSVGYGVDTENRVLYLADDLNSSSQQLYLPISIGFGRPYRVNDAWAAMSLFNDLECNGIASDRSQTKEVADLIVKQRFTRFRDARLGQIQNRAEFMEFLDNNDIVDFTPLSSAVINDSRQYENYRTRLSGFRINGGIIPRLASINNGNGNASPLSEKDFVLDPFVNFDFHLPISEDWQFDLSSYASYNNILFSESLTSVQTNSVASLSWIPNARIWASSDLAFSTFSNELFFDSKILTLSFSLDYYLSPRVRWNTNVYFSKNWGEQNNTEYNNLSQVFSGGLSYIIF